MYIFKTTTFTLPTQISPKICASFRKPIIFYLKNKNDVHSFFITFVILDFQKKTLTYISSYLPKNVATAENYRKMGLLENKSPIFNPHCAISIKKDEEFLVFFEVAPFFFRVNYRENTLKVYTEEILDNNYDEDLLSFSPTNYKDDQDSAYFYFSALIKNKITGGKNLCFYRSSLDLSDIEKIHSQPYVALNPPHVVRKIDHNLISSDFFTRPFKNLETGEVFENNLAYIRYVYKILYKEYCQKIGRVSSKQTFRENNHLSTNLDLIKLEKGFDSFCFLKGKNFIDICERNSKFNFDPLPGAITCLDLKTKQEKTCNTTFCAPAHFEVDTETGDVFASSHNFSSLGKIHFFGPAAIDRFSLKNGELKKISTFSHPTGYRFTSHRIFSWEGKNYICTFGHPNRLFFINADTMTLAFYEDIEIDLLSEQSDIAQYLNRSKVGFFEILNVEVSEDGQFVFFVSYEYMYIYSFPERKIVQKIKYNEGTSPEGEIILADYQSQTFHTNYLS